MDCPSLHVSPGSFGCCYGNWVGTGGRSKSHYGDVYHRFSTSHRRREPRRVLVKSGRKITNDVAMFLVGVLVKDKGFVAVACATLFSIMALVGIII
ncbi:hypothetical protein CsatB_018097 [Cannabis sativa]